LVLKKHYSDRYVSKLKQTARWNIRKWVNFYKAYGKIGLLLRMNQSYSAEFKLKVLNIIEKESLSFMQAGIRFNIPDISIVLKWKKDFANFGLVGLQPKQRGRPVSMSNNKGKKSKSEKPLTREQELLKENERLHCENELLKKLQALIQASKNQSHKRIKA
jgi:transposase